MMLTEHFQIHEIQNFQSILNFFTEQPGSENELVIYDLDNTILTYGHDLGTDQWFDHYFKKKISKGMSPNEAKACTLEQLTRLADTIKDLKPVEEKIPSLVKAIQARGSQSMILTSRGDYLKQATENQLQDQSLNLSFNAGAFKDIELSLEIGNGALLSNGVAYAAGQHKGHTLIEILNKINYFPKRIIFIDDKKYNLEHVFDALSNLAQPLEFIGLRYSFMDQDVKSLDPKIVRKQLEHFHNKPILSNEEALALWKLEQKHLKLKLGVKIEPEEDCVKLWGNRKSVYNALIKLDSSLRDMNDTPFFGNLNGGSDKLCWQFTMNKSKFTALKPELEAAKLLQPTQVEVPDHQHPSHQFSY
ncbi:MAG: DUF2608 domain-containing protein [Gammaproteobacteria bacterium]